MKPYLTGLQESTIEKWFSRLRKWKSLKCFFERVATQKCGTSRNCVQRKISIERRANRQAIEKTKKEKNKYFSESRAILAFPAFCQATCVAEANPQGTSNNPLGVLQILWGRGKNESQSKAKAPNKSLQPDSQKRRGFCKERKTRAPFACPLSFAVMRKKEVLWKGLLYLVILDQENQH